MVGTFVGTFTTCLLSSMRTLRVGRSGWWCLSVLFTDGCGESPAMKSDSGVTDAACDTGDLPETTLAPTRIIATDDFPAACPSDWYNLAFAADGAATAILGFSFCHDDPALWLLRSLDADSGATNWELSESGKQDYDLGWTLAVSASGSFPSPLVAASGVGWGHPIGAYIAVMELDSGTITAKVDMPERPALTAIAWADDALLLANPGHEDDEPLVLLFAGDDLSGALVADDAAVTYHLPKDRGSLLLTSVGDVDGDGRDEIVSKSDSSVLLVQSADLPFTDAFTEALRLDAWQLNNVSTVTAAGDVDGDGLSDVAIATFYTGGQATEAITVFNARDSAPMSVIDAKQDGARGDDGLDLRVANVGEIDGSGRDTLFVLNGPEQSGTGKSAGWLLLPPSCGYTDISEVGTPLPGVDPSNAGGDSVIAGAGWVALDLDGVDGERTNPTLLYW